MCRSDRGGRRARRVLGGLAVVLAGGLARPVAAQRVALQLLATGEVWETDADSRLLARNEGRPALQSRLDAWGILRPHPAVTLLALAEAEAGRAGEYDSDLKVPQLELRLAFDRAATLSGGRLLHPVGAFGARRFAHTNSLIDAPDTYPTQYPWGVQLSGVVGPLDYRAAVVDAPVYNERYLPEDGKVLRPAAALGIRTGPDFRFGVSGTVGPYLGEEVDPALPAGSDREDFQQIVIGAEARFSRGHLELWAEGLWNSYEVPTIADPVKGLGGYLEVRVTLTPRFFVAGRFEGNRYAFVLPISPALWIGRARTVLDGEVGAGYRLGRDLLIKASYRRDHWPEESPPGGLQFPDGYAFAFQGSWFVDVGELLERRY